MVQDAETIKMTAKGALGFGVIAIITGCGCLWGTSGIKDTENGDAATETTEGGIKSYQQDAANYAVFLQMAFAVRQEPLSLSPPLPPTVHPCPPTVHLWGRRSVPHLRTHFPNT
jgi:hypothetical protein